jgi:hypothetical protein
MAHYLKIHFKMLKVRKSIACTSGHLIYVHTQVFGKTNIFPRAKKKKFPVLQYDYYNETFLMYLLHMPHKNIILQKLCANNEYPDMLGHFVWNFITF